MIHRLLGGVLLLGVAISAAAPPAAAQASPEWIRVAVSRNDPDIQLQIQGRYTLFALHTNRPIHAGQRLLTATVRAVPQGLALGDEVLPYVGVRIEPERQAAINLNGKRLRGTVEIVRQKDQTLLVINHLPLEEYLRGVLSKEAPDYWPEEALKAIAITARTYALYQRLTKEQGDYDVTGDVLSQDYGGKSAEKMSTTRAVHATTGRILLYRGALFPTFYHSTCGGMTEHARIMGPFDLEPLQGGVVCRFCQASPFYAWQRRLTREDVAWALHKSPLGSVGTVKALTVARRTASGRVSELVIAGSRRSLTLSGHDFRGLFGFDRLRSALFTVTALPDGFVLEGHGWGHGVGLCQWGAAELARRGFSAEEILAYYYPRISVVDVREMRQQLIPVTGGTNG